MSDVKKSGSPNKGEGSAKHETDRPHWQRMVTNVYNLLKANRISAAVEALELFRWDAPSDCASEESDPIRARLAKCASRIWELFPADPLPPEDRAQSYLERLESLLDRGLLAPVQRTSEASPKLRIRDDAASIPKVTLYEDNDHRTADAKVCTMCEAEPPTLCVSCTQEAYYASDVWKRLEDLGEEVLSLGAKVKQDRRRESARTSGAGADVDPALDHAPARGPEAAGTSSLSSSAAPGIAVHPSHMPTVVDLLEDEVAALRTLAAAVGQLVRANDPNGKENPRPDIAWRDVRRAYEAVLSFTSTGKP